MNSRPKYKGPKAEEFSEFTIGLMKYDDGVHPILIWKGRKFFHSFYLDGIKIVRRYILFNEVKYFTTYFNSDDNPKEVKKIARFYLTKSKLTGLKREMSKTTKSILNKALEL